MQKSSVDEIRRRFDSYVDLFSNLETGQTTTVDAPLSLELIANAAARNVPNAAAMLDVGCGAGNYSLKILQHLPNLNITLIDLSKPMLERAQHRVGPATTGKITAIQGDIRDINLGIGQFDIICAAAVLHHLRSDNEWRSVFNKFHTALAPGGCLWISDLIEHEDAAVQELMWERYGQYLTSLKGPEHRDNVFAYIEAEDTPRSLTFQLDLLRSVGFARVDVLHKNSCFAAFGAIKAV